MRSAKKKNGTELPSAGSFSSREAKGNTRSELMPVAASNTPRREHPAPFETPRTVDENSVPQNCDIRHTVVALGASQPHVNCSHCYLIPGGRFTDAIHRGGGDICCDTGEVNRCSNPAHDAKSYGSAEQPVKRRVERVPPLGPCYGSGISDRDSNVH